jgi:hypothetical protein
MDADEADQSGKKLVACTSAGAALLVVVGMQVL